MIRMTDTKDLIGPLPEMPKTPVAPTPWKVNLPNYPEQILDAAGNAVGDFANEAVAELVMKLVNAAAPERVPEHKITSAVDRDGDRWWELAPDRFTQDSTLEDALESLRLRRHGFVDKAGDWVRDMYGPLTAAPVE